MEQFTLAINPNFSKIFYCEKLSLIDFEKFCLALAKDQQKITNDNAVSVAKRISGENQEIESFERNE